MSDAPELDAGPDTTATGVSGTVPEAGPGGAPGGSRPGPDPATRAAITAGRAPAIGRGARAARSTDAASAGAASGSGGSGSGSAGSGGSGSASTAASPGARDATRAGFPADRRGVLLGLATAGVAVITGVALNGRGASSDSGADAVAATGNTVEVTVTVSGMRFVPDAVDVTPGDRLVITLDNTSDQVHDLVLANGAESGRVAAGRSATVDVGVVTGPVEGWCSIAGHRAQGMVFHVTAAGTAGAAGHGAHGGGDAAGSGGSGGSAGSGGGAVPDYAVVLPADVRGFDPALAPADASVAVHEHTFTVTEQVMHVGAGVTQMRMTFNAGVPGPILRGRVGDVFRITLVNKGSMSHSIDFHAGVLPPDDVMRSINPGESLVYEFTAQRAGIWLYHCSTAPMSVHLASGMHGAVIIDPPNLTAVDREYVVVQSEIYLGPEGGQTDAAKVAAKTPDLFAFNGIAFQYRDRPFTARPGERVRFWVLDAGPSEPMSFHAVGLQFDQVFFEGAWTLGGPDRIGAAWSGGSQALGLHPAQGGFVECVPPAAGTYTVVSHSFADMEKGAMGHLVVAD
ncbi:multicopper oxidase domain-containing protein [Actinomyces sp. oral taxon 414]|uniref:multicopper oxidase domain-containing protein n=1 Tax=Actinomyces sp. oral taxon 414 TaxID=712122 RepID=UPI0009FB39AD|nr:multicopper oxidase domain-containing protein [Actinomyces sp. oral taxon 414]